MPVSDESGRQGRRKKAAGGSKETNSTVKYSVFTVVMGEYGPEEAAAELEELGYDGIEWRIHDDYHIAPAALGERAEEIKALTEAHGLKMPILGTYVDSHDLDAVENTLRAARVMKCPAIRVRSPLYDCEMSYDRVLNEAVGSLKQVERLSKAIGVRAVIEIHSGTIIPSACAAHRLIKEFDPRCVGLILDPGNMIIEGRENWQMGLEILGEYVAHVHVKNLGWFRREAPNEAKWEWKYTPLDKGMVNWKEVTTALRAIGYDGYLSIEDLCGGEVATTGLLQERLPTQNGRTVPTATKLERDLDYLQRMA